MGLHGVVTSDGRIEGCAAACSEVHLVMALAALIHGPALTVGLSVGLLGLLLQQGQRLGSLGADCTS